MTVMSYQIEVAIAIMGNDLFISTGVQCLRGLYVSVA